MDEYIREVVLGQIDNLSIPVSVINPELTVLYKKIWPGIPRRNPFWKCQRRNAGTDIYGSCAGSFFKMTSVGFLFRILVQVSLPKCLRGTFFLNYQRLVFRSGYPRWLCNFKYQCSLGLLTIEKFIKTCASKNN